MDLVGVQTVNTTKIQCTKFSKIRGLKETKQVEGMLLSHSLLKQRCTDLGCWSSGQKLLYFTHKLWTFLMKNRYICFLSMALV